MKKLLTIAAVAGMASLSYGQGYVNFANTTGSRISTNSVADASGGTGPAGLTAASAGAFYYALFVAPSTAETVGARTTGDPTLAGWTFTGDYAASQAALGRFLGYGTLDTSSVQVPNYAAGSTADFMVVGWSANLGSNWNTVQLYIDSNYTGAAPGAIYNVGNSIAGQAILAPAGGPYNPVMGSATVGLVGGFAMGSYLTNVPEPTTFALAGLGATALVIFRRRKV